MTRYDTNVPLNASRCGFPPTCITNIDPNAPKRALSAYMFFANDNRDAIRADNPGIAFGQVGKALGEKWKTLTDAEKVPYEEKATADKKRYEDEKAAYKANAAEFDEEE